MIRIGLLGAARIADKAIIQPAALRSDAVIAAVAASNLEKAQAFARQFDIELALGSYDELLARDDIDLIYNALPPSMHAEWSIKALQQGKHVLCEKPMALDRAEAQAMFDAAKRHGVKRFIFSSTAAVYGSPDSMDPCREDGPTAPISPYGSSKLLAESKVTDFISIPGNHGSSLRFFNVVGVANKALLDNSVENLVPIVINKIKAGQAPVIYGHDYPTTDGTCVRDYVDVRDIAAAHLAAADATQALPPTINIGTGNGASVREIVKFVIDAMGCSDVTPIDADRRAGDPAFLCADVALAKSAMGFTSRYSLKASVESLF